jgi:O-antigen/teichoic acid export membrane protein
VADANAARLLVAPLMLVNSGLTNVLLPRLVLLRSEERYIEAEQLAHRLMWMIAGIFVLYTALVVLADGRLTSLVLGDTYTGLESFIVAWAAVNLLTALRGNTSILLQVFKAFRTITLANIGSAVVVLILTWPLMYYYGVLGSIAAVALGEIILVVLLRSGFARVRRTYAG